METNQEKSFTEEQVEDYEKEVQVKALTDRINQAAAAYLNKEDLEQKVRQADYRLRAAQTKVYEVGGEHAWQILEKGKVVISHGEANKILVLFDHDEYGFVIKDVIELTDIELEIY